MQAGGNIFKLREVPFYCRSTKLVQAIDLMALEKNQRDSKNDLHLLTHG